MVKAIFISCFIFLCIFQGEIAFSQTRHPLRNTLQKAEDLINEGNWIAAEQIFELTENNIHSGFTDNEKVKFYNEWGKQLFNHSYYSDGFRQYKKAETLLNNQIDTVLKSRLFLNIGNAHFRLGNKIKSKIYHQKSLELIPFFENTNIDEAYIWMSIGVIRFIEDSDSADFFLHKAANIASKFNDNKLSSNIHLNLGNHYALNGETKRAKNHYDLAVKYARKTTDNTFLSKIQARSLSMGLHLFGTDKTLSKLKLFSHNMKKEKQWEAYSISQLQISLYYDSLNKFEPALTASREVIMAEKEITKKSLKEFSSSYSSKIEGIKKNNLNIIALKNLEIKQSDLKKSMLITLCIFLIVVILMSIIMIRRKTNFIKIVEEKLELQEKEIQLKKVLELKNQELIASSLKLSENNKALERTVSQLKKIKHNSDSQSDISNLLSELKLRTTTVSWEEFDLKFSESNTDFIKSLLSKYPNLTANEKRLAYFIKLNLSTKEISSITKQSINSIDVGKSRLRKKMNIQSNETLENIIINI